MVIEWGCLFVMDSAFEPLLVAGRPMQRGYLLSRT